MKLIFENWRKYLTEQVFRKGMKDPQTGTKEGPIAQIQLKLIGLGFMDQIPESEFGFYGPKTAAAVEKFQEKVFPNQPNEHDGVVGEDTIGVLKVFKSDADIAIKTKQKPTVKDKTPALRPATGRPKALIIGDSHVDWSSFGKYLTKKLESQGYDVTKHGVGGSAAASWIRKRGELLDKLSQAGPWDLLLISLGTNDIANSNVHCKGDKRCLEGAAAKKANQIGQVAQKVSANKKVWIAPPTLHGSKHYSQVAGDAMYTVGTPSGVDVVVDSRPSTKGKRRDKVHPGGAQARAWASAVVAAV